MAGQTVTRTAAAGFLALWAVLPGAGTGAATGSGAVRAGAPAPLSVTFAARACDRYDQVMANKARNNVQESLRDLGPDSDYARTEAVSAAKEAGGTPLPPCRPLPGWGFSTGTGFTGKTAATLQLSTVRGFIRDGLDTQDETPELDSQGRPTGRTLAGAVTVQLNQAETAAAVQNRLIVQGGSPSRPLNGLQDQYGFAALRCSQDAINGDNVEYVTFPAGARHVFCYYYAVTPPPGAGTITVVKQLAPGSNGPGSFRFEGNVSYADSNGDGVNDFPLTADTGKPGSVTFVRGETRDGDAPWTFQERVTPGWQPPGPPSCTIRDAQGGQGTSRVTVDSAATTSIRLTAGDNVTCTYTNTRDAGQALLQKQSTGSTGTFDIRLDTPPGSPPIAIPPVTTAQEDVPVEVASAAGAAPGRYTLRERIPAPDATGSWQTPDAACDGTALPVTTLPPTPDAPNGTWTAERDIASPGGTSCLLTNHFRPGGAIAIEKVSEGGTGTFAFAVTPHPSDRQAGPGDRTVTAEATTTAPGEPAAAHPTGSTTGPVATALRVGPTHSYTVQELLPAPSATGRWVLAGADCGAGASAVDLAAGTVELALTTAAPTPVCRFTNRFVPYATLDVSKTTTGDTALRPSAARLALSCEDGTADELTVAPGETTGALPRHTFTAATRCTVTEPESGAASGIGVTASAVLKVTGAADRAVALGTPFELTDGQAATLAVGNELTAPGASPSPSPSSPPTPSPTPSPDTSPGPSAAPSSDPAPSGTPAPVPPPGPSAGGGLPWTGLSEPMLLAAIVAVPLLAAGVLLAVVSRRGRTE
ncbi:hypothetical protein ACIRBX_14525 [Kitasatospora sp. NPDC096147]|uniref:prealbumin-like fold domain-containing protein n=1 Tax=Kitasatospora sp. NPDC096147 TaxID=3364093 RepID=UPI0037FD1C7A